MKRKLLRIPSLLFIAFLIGVIGFIAIIIAGNYMIDDEKLVMNYTTTIVDSNGEDITKLYLENRELMSIHDIPEHVQQAFIAIEDSRFYEHQGLDLRAIGRAVYRDIMSGSKAEGGSTITQQLAKNVFLSNEKTWLRKTKEILIAINLERRYSKDEILSMYLNRIYFGHGAYGLQAASQLYFGKDVNDLTIEEGALLAGVPKAPNHYSPIHDLERSKQRRDLVLTVMQRNDYITAEEMVRLQGKTVALNESESIEDEAFYTYIDLILDEAADRYQLSNEEVLSGGYTIVAPIDRGLQEASFEKIKDPDYFPEENADAEASFVLMDSETGGLLAAQGGREYVRKGLNRVNVKRQPGSTFKPLAVFAPALEMGSYLPYTLLPDELMDYEGYTPRNSNGVYAGELTMYEAITQSANAPAVWLLNEIGIEASHQFLNQFGFQLNDERLPLALGGLSEGVSPFELTKAYRAFAHEGKVVEPYTIEKIYDRNGELIGQANPEEREVLSPQTAWYMTRMLESVVQEGTGRYGETQTALAGKTGTTSIEGSGNGAKDAWFVGFTPSVVGAVWFGYDITSSEHYLRGGSAYPTAWFKDLLNELPDEKRQLAFEKPPHLQELEPPVQLAEINDLRASVKLGGRGLFSIDLEWTGLEDERVYYDVYEVDKEESTHLATVIGESHYRHGRFNPFSSKSYVVVPLDSTTERAGEPSNSAEVSIGFSF